MSNYHFDAENRFVIEDYDAIPPFASFLPGIAGPLGIPLWAFYVNRGQAIASFGIENKDHPTLEFQPANKAYRLTPLLGFRTFLKLAERPDMPFYEPFAPWAPGRPQRAMHVDLNELTLVEENKQAGLKAQVTYFILPGEPVAALVRQVTLTNIAAQPLELELLDGLPTLVPFGADNAALKNISRTIEAWMHVEGYAEGLPFYRLHASAADTAEVSTIQAGHFAFDDVVAAINDKLVRRHPHVFGDVQLSGVQEVRANWETIKQAEKQTEALSAKLMSYGRSLPPLMATMKISEKVAGIGFDWSSETDIWAKFAEEQQEFSQATDPDQQEAEFGDMLFSLLQIARWHNIDPSRALSATNAKFAQRFRRMEQMADRPLCNYTITELEALWQLAKQ